MEQLCHGRLFNNECDRRGANTFFRFRHSSYIKKKKKNMKSWIYTMGFKWHIWDMCSSGSINWGARNPRFSNPVKASSKCRYKFERYGMPTNREGSLNVQIGQTPSMCA